MNQLGLCASMFMSTEGQVNGDREGGRERCFPQALNQSLVYLCSEGPMSFTPAL